MAVVFRSRSGRTRTCPACRARSDIKATVCNVCGVPMPKHRNKKVTIDGMVFGSEKEGKRYLLLKLAQDAGVIEHLEIHPRFALVVNGVKICRYYEADFSYRDYKADVKKKKLRWDGDRFYDFIVEDVKGQRTRVFIIKKNLMKAVHGIDVVEIR